jgi:hypothetical protein
MENIEKRKPTAMKVSLVCLIVQKLMKKIVESMEKITAGICKFMGVVGDDKGKLP